MDVAMNRIDEIMGRHLPLSYDILSRDGIREDAWYTVATLNRSHSLCRSFLLLARADEFTVALALVRLQLDTALRYVAMFHYGDPLGSVERRSEFVKRVMNGEQINKIKSRANRPMTDAHLLELLVEPMDTETAAHVRTIYKSASGSVHMSDRHLFDFVTHVGEGDGTMSMALFDGSAAFEDDVKSGIVGTFGDVTELGLQLAEVWREQTIRAPDLSR